MAWHSPAPDRQCYTRFRSEQKDARLKSFFVPQCLCGFQKFAERLRVACLPIVPLCRVAAEEWRSMTKPPEINLGFFFADY
jgi:hypothetical protein